MVSVDSTYYLETYLGIDPDTGLDRLLARATDDILLACQGGIDETTLDDATITNVKKAVCAQVEFYVNNGDTYNESETAGQERIGSWQKTRNLQQARPQGAICARAKSFLEQTGLMYRGVRLC